MYPTFAKEAKEEGFDEIAALFEMVADIEKRHDERYQQLTENIDKGIVYKRDTETGMDLYKLRTCTVRNRGA